MVIELVTELVILKICYKNKIMAKNKNDNNNVLNICTNYILFF